jgi:hypothetical protein
MDVFVLGAGFSHAIHRRMPTLGQLREPLNEFLGQARGFADARYPRLDNVELFLSALAEPQPHLSDSDNMRNAALFFDVAEWLSGYIHACQNYALSEAMPDWLEHLIEAWHVRRSTVECAVGSLALTDRNGRAIHSEDVYATPIGVGTRLGVGLFNIYQRRETFKLCKLHGSLSWLRDHPTDEPWDAQVWRTPFGGRERETWADIRQRTHGLGQPMIVPPTLVKSGYLDNLYLRANWRAASEGLGSAETVVLLGYSMPAGDTQTATLIGTASEEGPNRRIVIVDTAPDDVVERVKKVALPRAGTVSASSYDDQDDPIAAFAEAWSADPDAL